MNEEDKEGDVKGEKENQLQRQGWSIFNLYRVDEKGCYMCVLRNHTVKALALFTLRMWFTESVVPNDILSLHQGIC